MFGLLADCAPDVSRHGRACPGHPRRAAAKPESAIRAPPARPTKSRLYALRSTRGRAAPDRVDGRDKPGHDALRPAREALPYSDFLAPPTANATRAQTELPKNRIMCYCCLPRRLGPFRQGRYGRLDCERGDAIERLARPLCAALRSSGMTGPGQSERRQQAPVGGQAKAGGERSLLGIERNRRNRA